MDRRQFVKTSTMGISSLASGLSTKNLQAQPASGAGRPETPSENVVGRPVRIVSIGFTQGHALEEIAGLVDQEGGRGTDLIALPETWRGQDLTSAETLEGPTIKTISALARKHQTYIVCPIDRLEGKRRYNSSILLDRQGQVVSIYNKLYPVWLVECMKEPPQQPVHPGEGAVVHQADFGRVGLAICFDVNWGALWERMANLGAELVVWSSAYSAGRSLQAQATLNNYYIVSSTLIPRLPRLRHRWTATDPRQGKPGPRRQHHPDHAGLGPLRLPSGPQSPGKTRQTAEGAWRRRRAGEVDAHGRMVRA